MSSPTSWFSTLSNVLPPTANRLLLIAIVALGAQGWALNADFYMDDFLHIVGNEEIQSGDISGGLASRILPKSLWRQVYLSQGFHSLTYHTLNLVTHVVLALLLASVITSLVRLHPNRAARESASSMGLWGALLFACHPLVTEPVNYAAQLTIVMATLFSVAAVWWACRWRETGKLSNAAGVLACLVLASISKEPGFWHALINLFFVALLLVDQKHLAFLQNRRARLTLIGCVGFVGILFTWSWFGMVIGRFADSERMLHYTLTQARVLSSYLSQMVIPIGLCSDHHIPWSISLADKEALLKLTLTVIAAAAILYAYLVKRSWLAAICGLILFHLLVRFAYSVDELMVEYRTYPSMPWVGLLMAYLIWRVTEGRQPSYRQIRLAVSAAVVIVFGVMSIQRSQTWGNAAALSVEVSKSYPTNLRALANIYEHRAVALDFHNLARDKDVAATIREAILDYNRESNTREYSPIRADFDFVTCRYYTEHALLATGHTDEAHARAHQLLVDQLKGDIQWHRDSVRSTFLSAALTASLKRDQPGLERVLRAAGFLPELREEVENLLQMELALAKVNRERQRMMAAVADEAGD